MNCKLTSNEFERTTAVADLIYHAVPDISWDACCLATGHLFYHYRYWKHAASTASYLVHDDDAWWLVRVIGIETRREEEHVYLESMTIDVESTYSPEAVRMAAEGIPVRVYPPAEMVPDDEGSRG